MEINEQIEADKMDEKGVNKENINKKSENSNYQNYIDRAKIPD